MTQMTHLSRTVDNTEYEAKYDAAAKNLVSDKQVLARIVKGTVKEFEDYSIDEIIAGIEGEPEVAVREVFPGKHSNKEIGENAPGAIYGMNTESAIPGEGKVTYDIYFYVLTRGREAIKIIINIELQKKYWIIKLLEGLPNFLRVFHEGFIDFGHELMRVFREGLV